MIFAGLQPGSYGALLVDPPWRFALRSEVNLTKSPQGQYECMELADIQALPVRELANPAGCMLFLWATWPMLPHALATLQAWGFEYKTGGSWAKLSSTGRCYQMGTGYIYRSASELWLVGTVGKPVIKSRSIRNLIVAAIRAHSQKPEEMRVRIEQLTPGPYAELFSRSNRPGWTAWGNEMGKFDGREAS